MVVWKSKTGVGMTRLGIDVRFASLRGHVHARPAFLKYEYGMTHKKTLCIATNAATFRFTTKMVFAGNPSKLECGPTAAAALGDSHRRSPVLLYTNP